MILTSHEKLKHRQPYKLIIVGKEKSIPYKTKKVPSNVLEKRTPTMISGGDEWRSAVLLRAQDWLFLNTKH